jgi:hypothetical protein
MKCLIRKAGVVVFLLSVTSIAQADDFTNAYNQAAGTAREVVYNCLHNIGDAETNQALAEQVVSNLENLSDQLASMNLEADQIKNLRALSEQMFSAINEKAADCLNA